MNKMIDEAENQLTSQAERLKKEVYYSKFRKMCNMKPKSFLKIK